MVSLWDAATPTPTPGAAWQQLSEEERLALVVNVLRNGSGKLHDVIALAAKQDGQVIVGLAKSMPAGERGSLLLDLEASLKKTIDPGLVLWLEPLGDRNSLRNLRGIEVKA